MSLVNRSGGFAVVIVVAAALCNGCSRQIGALAPGPTTNSRQPLPFDRAPENSGVSPTAKLTPREIPAGTQLEVRSQTILSSARSRAGDTFEAVLAEPLILQNETVAAPGSILRGTVSAVAPAAGSGQAGYLRVTLTSIKIADQTLPLKTSSVFAKGSLRSGHKDASFSTRRQLRFDVLQPIDLAR